MFSLPLLPRSRKRGIFTHCFFPLDSSTSIRLMLAFPHLTTHDLCYFCNGNIIYYTANLSSCGLCLFIFMRSGKACWIYSSCDTLSIPVLWRLTLPRDCSTGSPHWLWKNLLHGVFSVIDSCMLLESDCTKLGNHHHWEWFKDPVALGLLWFTGRTEQEK